MVFKVSTHQGIQHIPSPQIISKGKLAVIVLQSSRGSRKALEQLHSLTVANSPWLRDTQNTIAGLLGEASKQEMLQI